VSRGAARDDLLETYERERWPVGRFLLRYTDRIFGALTRSISSGRVASWARELFMKQVLPGLVTAPWLRASAFRFVSELAIHYRRSPLAVEGSPRLKSGPRPGERLPDARVTIDGRAGSLQREVVGPHFTLLLCGDAPPGDEQVNAILAQYPGLLEMRRLSSRGARGGMVDAGGSALMLLDGEHGAHYLVRPDGYIAYRAGGSDLEGLRAYLERWLVPGP